MSQIAANSVLPARRHPVSLLTEDGVRLVGEWSLPLDYSSWGNAPCSMSYSPYENAANHADHGRQQQMAVDRSAHIDGRQVLRGVLIP